MHFTGKEAKKCNGGQEMRMRKSKFNLEPRELQSASENSYVFPLICSTP